MSQATPITTDRFREQVIQSPVPVLVDFYADWCPPCRMLAPILDTLARRVDGEGRIVKVNVDHEPALARRYRINSIPTLIVFAGGREVDRIAGLASPEQLRQKLLRAEAA